MIASYARLLRLSILVSCLLPVLVAGLTGTLRAFHPRYWITLGAAIPIALAAGIAVDRLLSRLRPQLDELGAEQVAFLDRLPARRAAFAIAGSAALSLLLELAVIRWQGTVWEFFAFYKNLGLLSCFAGLGLGYALAGRKTIPLVFTAPLLALQVLVLEAMRHGMGEATLSLRRLPFQEQLAMGVHTTSLLPNLVAVYSFLSVVFLLTALAFVPVGQVCGRLMNRRPPLLAYGLNLLGSVAGVLLMFGASYLWTPPAIWFSVCFAGIALLQVYRREALLVTTLATLVALSVMAWPSQTGWERIYSPYQLLERGAGERGLMTVRAAGHYYQRVHDLSEVAQSVSHRARGLADYYGLPYRLRSAPLRDVAIVGAGTGNDVAAALRAGVQSIAAIEIDPAIVTLGRMYHPERPFDDPRVRLVVDDARSFLRTTGDMYDMVVYGLLDSHTLLSHVSSVRLDSFVYTVEGFRDARAHLRDGGLMVLSFAVLSDELGRKIFLMMEEAFDGRPPVCVNARYDGSVVFAQTKNGELKVPADVLAETGFRDVTALYASPLVHADVSTDDWPFFYMPQRVYPTSYLFFVGLVFVLSAALFASLLTERPHSSEVPFFFLGAGFMLVETKGITELGLVLGNTWQVIGIVIAGVLLMAFLANLVVAGLKIRRPLIPYVLLLASLAAGLGIAGRGGVAPTAVGRVVAVVVLTCPVFFSGIVFSTLLTRTRTLAGAMALNLVGAMLGGLLEYNSMYFGLQSLYWLAIVLYAAAALSSYVRRRPSVGFS